MGKRLLLGVVGLVWSLGALANVWAVNKPVANMYKSADEDSSVVSQAIYNTPVEAIEARGDYIYVQVPDGYRGWMKRQNLIGSEGVDSKHVAEVTSLFAKIYRIKDTIPHKPIITVPFGTRLALLYQSEQRWAQVRLANGGKGWIQYGDITIDPKPLTMAQMLRLSKKFLGIPYEWGGVSTYGIDCSGYVQMLYEQMGIQLPRDATLQVESPLLREVSQSELKPGDLLYFGWDHKISHAGMYLGHGDFISITTYQKPYVQIAKLSLPYWQHIYITARRLKKNSSAPQFHATVTALPLEVKREMQKYTWRPGCPVALADLAYLQLNYWGFDKRVHQGALIVNRKLADNVVAIFDELYKERFPLAKMEPMYRFKGNDELAMRADNTSAFNCRRQTDFPDLFSVHSYGSAIDINPLINPYVNGSKVEPAAGKKYLDRTVPSTGKIIPNGQVVQLFSRYGWLWGGDWKQGIKDYQHFERALP